MSIPSRLAFNVSGVNQIIPKPGNMINGDQKMGCQPSCFIMAVAARGASVSARRVEQISTWKYKDLIKEAVLVPKAKCMNSPSTVPIYLFSSVVTSAMMAKTIAFTTVSPPPMSKMTEDAQTWRMFPSSCQLLAVTIHYKSESQPLPEREARVA